LGAQIQRRGIGTERRDNRLGFGLAVLHTHRQRQQRPVPVLEIARHDGTAFSQPHGLAEIRFGIRHIHNFYGFVEQLGSIFVEADDGLLYAPNYADVIVRDPATLQPLPVGETGLLQVVSLLPKSYPGHSILTEDLGIVERVDNSSIGRMGKGIRVLGRLPASELRGCSDVIAAAA